MPPAPPYPESVDTQALYDAHAQHVEKTPAAQKRNLIQLIDPDGITDQRAMHRKVRNRESAQRVRARKRAELEALNHQKRELETRVNEQNATINDLRCKLALKHESNKRLHRQVRLQKTELALLRSPMIASEASTA